jgi:hypothetical protein
MLLACDTSGNRTRVHRNKDKSAKECQTWPRWGAARRPQADPLLFMRRSNDRLCHRQLFVMASPSRRRSGVRTTEARFGGVYASNIDMYNNDVIQKSAINL